MTGAIAGLVLPAVAVWLVIDALGGGRVIRSRLARAALATGAGVGLSAVTTYWFVTVGTGFGWSFVAADVAVWIAISLAAYSVRQPVTAPGQEACRMARTDWMVRGLFAMIAAVTVLTLIRGHLSLPHGDWDAWAIWNQKARFLFRGGAGWTDALTIQWSHPAHPLLLPLSVARLWAYAGADLPLVPALLGIAFGASTVAVVMGGLGTNHRRAWLAGAVLLAPGAFITQWTAQQADVPFAFFMVSGLMLLGHARTASWPGAGEAQRPLLLAGILVGLAAWTKNEGLLLVCTMTLLAVAVAIRSGRRVGLWWWAAGLAPTVLTVAWFKMIVAPVLPYYLPEGPLLVALLQRWTEQGHRAVIDGALWHGWTTWGDGAFAMVSLASVGLACSRAGRVTRELVVVPLVMLAAYYVVYLLTSLDVAWLIGTTFNRLLTQLWPSFVLAAFFIVERAPTDVTAVPR